MYWGPRWFWGPRRYYRPWYGMWGRPWRRRPLFLPGCGCGCGTLMLMLFGLMFLAFLARVL